jgi:hypothetical protein
VADYASYQVVGGQREAFEALRAFSATRAEPVVVDLGGLADDLRDSFDAFLATTGLTVVEWLDRDVVVLTATPGRGDGDAGVREPRMPPPPSLHLAVVAPGDGPPRPHPERAT